MNTNQHNITNKLNGFIRKYYYNQLIKGTLLFMGLGLLYLIINLLLEHLLWFSVSIRTALFILVVLVESFLFIKFIVLPVFKLFSFQKGISYQQASSIIGTHFPEVSDKLLNYLQLSSSLEQSELLLASIDQKAKDLSPIPFAKAIQFTSNYRYLPYLLLPVLLISLFWLTGNASVLTQSYSRLVSYNTPFQAPPPYSFVIKNSKLETTQGTDFTLKVSTIGKIVPESISIQINSETYYMKPIDGGFEYTFQQPLQSIPFRLVTPSVTSSEYTLRVQSVPSIQLFEMKVIPPKYLNKPTETIVGMGNATVLEGSKVIWNIKAQSTDKITFTQDKQTTLLSYQSNQFKYSKSIHSDTDYILAIHNRNFPNFEKLNYKLVVVKDQYPTIQVNKAPDTLNLSKTFLIGKMTDDYGLTKLCVRYYPKDNPKAIQSAILSVKGTVDQFVYSFPNGILLPEGISYNYYFEVFDNDAINHFKSTRSEEFTFRQVTKEELQQQQLQDQSNSIKSLEKSLQQNDKTLKDVQQLQKSAKENESLDFKEQKQLQDYLKRQQQQDNLMKSFSKKLEENLQKFNPETTDEYKQELEKRIENNQKQIEEKEKLVKELEELTKKINNEQLYEKLEKIKQLSKNQSKSIEQLLELTKRYYVEKKTEQLIDKLQKLSEKQEQLSFSKENSIDKQEQIKQDFKDIQQELSDVQKENKELKTPLDINPNPDLQEDIKQEMQKASEALQKNNKEQAQKKQKSSSQKMNQMAQAMQQGMDSQSAEQMEEDASLLRQILDNLLSFSFEQETLLNQFKKQNTKSPSFSSLLKKQQSLKQQFKHIDDSIFAVSLRNPKISDKVISVLGETHYNIESSLTAFSDGNIYKGNSHQQYVITQTNILSDMLSDILSNLQMEMSGIGQGKGKGKGKGSSGSGKEKQLSDIIQKQGELSDKIKQGMQSGNKPNGNSGKGSGSEGSGNEGEIGGLLEILKEQQQLREALQKALSKSGASTQGQGALNQMKDIEKQLINKGFKNEVFQKSLNLKHELLKLQKAIQQQGEDNSRQSETNQKQHSSNNPAIPKELLKYIQSTEVLNRENLFAIPKHNEKINQYFQNQ